MSPAVARTRLAVVISHPIQYYSPWFKHLAATEGIELKVFYLWDFGVTEQRERTFGTTVRWDIPLLGGYDSEFIENRSSDPGTHHPLGLWNPALPRRIMAWQPDAILLYGYLFATHLLLQLNPALHAVPMLFRGDSHGLCRTDNWKAFFTRHLRTMLFKRFEAFLAVGKANARWFVENGVPAKKIHHVPHCVDNARFQAAEHEARVEALEWKRSLGISEGQKVVLFTGKLEEQKRPIDLLEAFLLVAEEKAVLLFAGSGEQEPRLRERAGQQIGRTVFFAPFQNQTQMPKVYAAGNVLVLPSRSETWGLVVNEAMSLGLPAIVSSHVGCAEDLVIPGQTGWVFEAGNVEALCGCIREALSSPAILEQFSQNCRRHIDNYSYEAATRGLLEALGAHHILRT
jgi:glycosyltransferase involved in cell wall biosynthesis